MNWMYKEDFLAHYGVKGMKWHRRKGLKISNDTDAYKEWDPSAKWFLKTTAKEKMPGRSKVSSPDLYFRSGERTSEGKMVQRASVTKIASTIDRGKELIDDILNDIGNFFLTMFNKKH